MKKLVKAGVAAAAVLSLAAFTTGCSKKQNAPKADSSAKASDTLDISYSDIVLGKTGTDITATLKLLSHRTDMMNADYPGTTWAQYLAEFNKVYPNIKVEIDGITDYASTALLRL